MYPPPARIACVALSGGLSDLYAEAVVFGLGEAGAYVATAIVERDGLDPVAAALPDECAIAVSWIRAPEIFLHEEPPGVREVTVEVVLPGANPADFYLERSSAPAGGGGIFGLVRSDDLASALELTEAALGRVGAFGIAATGGEAFLEAVTVQPVEAEGFFYEGPEARVTLRTTRASSEYGVAVDLDGFTVPASLIPAMGIGLSLVAGAPLGFPGTAASTRVRGEARASRRVSVAGAIAIACVIAIAMLFEQTYAEPLATLSRDVRELDAGVRELEAAAEARREADRALQALGADRESFAPYYADRVFAALPAGVKLTRLEVFPQVDERGTYEDSDPPWFLTDEIVVEGSAESAAEYTAMSSSLERIKHVSRLYTEAYETDERGRVFFTATLALRR